MDGLQPALPIVVDQRPPGDVANGEHVRMAGPHRLIHHDAVAADQPGLQRNLHVGQDTHTDQHQLRRQDLAVAKPHARHRPDALEPVDPRAKPHIRPGLAMNARVERPDLRPRHARQHLLHRLQHRHLEPQLHAHGGSFEPNIARPDNNQTSTGRRHLFQPVDIRQRPQFRDTLQLGPRQAQLAGPRAGGDHQLVPTELPPARQLNRFGGQVDCGRRLAHQKLNAMLGVVFQRLQEQPLSVHLALEIGLGQRRTLIGWRGFIADKGDFAHETALPQRVRRLPTRLACANDYNALGRIRHTSSPSRSAGVLAWRSG